ncbi:hypothetical protein GBA52_002995 [Prunus armeniaca]|nr:hypothetical protein GBA52_002995 [Prunus armeniaca]
MQSWLPPPLVVTAMVVILSFERCGADQLVVIMTAVGYRGGLGGVCLVAAPIVAGGGCIFFFSFGASLELADGSLPLL